MILRRTNSTEITTNKAGVFKPIERNDMVFRERVRERRSAFELSSVTTGLESRVNTGVRD
jgi:hypothetical protein